MNVNDNYAISVSREDFIDELIMDKVSGSDSPEKKASNTSWNTGFVFSVKENKVIEERNLRASRSPKIPSADFLLKV